jgi:heat shock protein HtpX
MLYFALSRRREYLADACGAQYTRYPEGLASALEKIGGINVPQADQSRVTAPMYIVRPLAEGQKRSMTSAFSTHPPIEERVRILRGMGGQADFQAYDQAYGTVRKGRGVIGSRSLADAPALAAIPPVEATPEPPSTSRLREASNAYLSGSGYETRDCPGCGALVKIPPSMTARVVTCPRCAAGL